MALTQSEKQNIRDMWAKRQQNSQERTQILKEQATQRAGKIARLLKSKYGVVQVYLYGSLAKNEVFDNHSDIDLFIEGWREENIYWVMFSEAESIARPYNVSIITDKEAFPSIIDTVYREGRIIK